MAINFPLWARRRSARRCVAASFRSLTPPLLRATQATLLSLGCVSAAQAAAPIVLGQSLPQYSEFDDGRAMLVQAGAMAYVEAVNASGGIAGRQLKLVTLTDSGDPALHAKNLRDLAKNYKAVAFLNCLGEVLCAAASKVSEELHIPLVGLYTGGNGLPRAKNPYAFRVRVNYAKEADAMARQMQVLGIARTAVVTDGREDAEPVLQLKAALESKGMEAVVLPIAQLTPDAIEAFLQQLGKGGFQAAALDLRSDTLNLIVKKGLDRREEWPATLISLANETRLGLMGNFPRRIIAFSAVVPNPERSNLPLLQELQRAGENSGGPVAVNYFGLEAYINAKLCAEGLRRAMARTGAEGSVGPEGLFHALDNMTDVDLGGFRVSFARSRSSGADFVEVDVRPRLKER